VFSNDLSGRQPSQSWYDQVDIESAMRCEYKET